MRPHVLLVTLLLSACGDESAATSPPAGKDAATTVDAPSDASLDTAAITDSAVDDTTVDDTAIDVEPVDAAPPRRLGLALGGFFSCGWKSDGSVWCWGENSRCELGDGTLDDRFVPKRVPFVDHVVQVAAGESHACALLEDGKITCWGNAQEGALPKSVATEVSGTGGPCARTARSITPYSNVAQITAGQWHTCMRLADGTAQCFGNDDYHQLATVVVVADGGIDVTLTSLVDVVAGGVHTCARRGDGKMLCWGGNYSGESDPSTSAKFAGPNIVFADTTAMALLAGTSCTIRTGGAVWCWGQNAFGELAIGTHAMGAAPPAAALDPLSSGVLQIAAGFTHACARKSTSIVCWGDDTGDALGFPTSDTCGGTAGCSARASEVPLPSADGVLALGYLHNCFLSPDGTTRCWGDNTHGQIGDGTKKPTKTPVVIDW